MRLINTSLRVDPHAFEGGELSTTVALTSTEIKRIHEEQHSYMSVEEECNTLFKTLSDFSRGYIERDNKSTRDFIQGYIYGPKKVIFNGPATIVIWNDNTKTIVKRREGEPDDKEKAVMYCIIKKWCGNKAAMDKYLKLFLKEELNNE